MKPNLQDHVTSLELCRKLKRIGFPQNSLHDWHLHNESDSLFVEKKDFLSNDGSSIPLCSAPLATELLEVLPACIESDVNGTKLFYPELHWEDMGDDDFQYQVGYISICGEYELLGEGPFIDSKLQNSLALLYIHLKQKGLL